MAANRRCQTLDGGVLYAFCHSSTVSRAKSSEPRPRIVVNDALTIHRLVANGAGIGCVSGYLCRPDFESGRLTHLLPEWTPPSVEVNVVFPSHRELAPAVRAFVDFIKSASQPGVSWQDGD